MRGGDKTVHEYSVWQSCSQSHKNVALKKAKNAKFTGDRLEEPSRNRRNSNKCSNGYENRTHSSDYF